MRRVLSSLLALTLLLAVLGAAGYLLLGGRVPGAPAAGTRAPYTPPAAADPFGGSDLLLRSPALRGGTDVDVPTPGHEEESSPLGDPAPVAQPSTEYAFLSRQPDGSPVAYDPCRPIHYVLRPDQAPPGTAELLDQAFAAVSQATGMQFVSDGETAELPSADREVFQPDRYGDRWAPLLVAWRTADQFPPLAGDVIGVAASRSMLDRGRPEVYVSGQMVLDAHDLSLMLRRADGPAEVRAVMMHELGHVVGLAHSQDRAQLMYPAVVAGVVAFADGDLTGLAQLGRGACAPWL